MIRQSISIPLKKKCVEMRKQGASVKDIYEYYKTQVDSVQSLKSFRTSLMRWDKRIFPDATTLECGTYEGFTAHNATVQVSADGEIVQAWIKQSANEIDPEEFIQAIKDNVERYEYIPKEKDNSRDMLEIPLFDMHWGIAYMDYYKSVLDEILELITSQHWNKIVIPFGQDFFHNDSIVNGQTTKGTNIEKVDMMRAIKEGQQFMYAIIDNAIAQSDEVCVMYSPGNHDRSISWMFMQVLLERYVSTIVDDSLLNRKCITYGKNSIMVTHGDSRRATPKNLAPMFSVSFPEQFANTEIREVHAGHLHSESDADIYGVMVRRLSSGSKTDEWTDKEDLVGAHKRFMLFQWSPDKLKSIHYI